MPSRDFTFCNLADYRLGGIPDFRPHPRGAVPLAKLLKLGVLFTWIFMIVKTAQNQSFRLPILGELAERSVAEQKF